MKKKAILIFLIVVLSITLIGCDPPDDTENENMGKIFVEIESNFKWKVVYDKETKVMYAVSNDTYNSGIFTMLVDESGKPKLWEGE